MGIRSIMEPTSKQFDGIPTLADAGGDILRAENGVHASIELGERVLKMGALGKSGSQEDGIDGDENPGPALEEDCRYQETDPYGNFEPCDDRHGTAIIFLNKPADFVGEWVGSRYWLRIRRASRLQHHLGRDCGNEAGSSITSDVEDRIDCVR